MRPGGDAVSGLWADRQRRRDSSERLPGQRVQAAEAPGGGNGCAGPARPRRPAHPSPSKLHPDG